MYPGIFLEKQNWRGVRMGCGTQVRRAESGVGFLERGNQPLPPARGSG